MIRGETCRFNVNSLGHPYLIKTARGTGTSSTFNDGVASNGFSKVIVMFQLPQNAPEALFYNCEFQGSMTGVLSII